MGLLNGKTQLSYYQGNDLGNYQFTSLDDIISQFQIAYVGEGKIIPKINIIIVDKTSGTLVIFVKMIANKIVPI